MPGESWEVLEMIVYWWAHDVWSQTKFVKYSEGTRGMKQKEDNCRDHDDWDWDISKNKWLYRNQWTGIFHIRKTRQRVRKKYEEDAFLSRLVGSIDWSTKHIAGAYDWVLTMESSTNKRYHKNVCLCFAIISIGFAQIGCIRSEFIFFGFCHFTWSTSWAFWWCLPTKSSATWWLKQNEKRRTERWRIIELLCSHANHCCILRYYPNRINFETNFLTNSVDSSLVYGPWFVSASWNFLAKPVIILVVVFHGLSWWKRYRERQRVWTMNRIIFSTSCSRNRCDYQCDQWYAWHSTFSQVKFGCPVQWWQNVPLPTEIIAVRDENVTGDRLLEVFLIWDEDAYRCEGVEYRYSDEHRAPKQVYHQSMIFIGSKQTVDSLRVDVRHSIYHPISFATDDWQRAMLVDKICAWFNRSDRWSRKISMESNKRLKSRTFATTIVSRLSHVVCVRFFTSQQQKEWLMSRDKERERERNVENTLAYRRWSFICR